MCSIMKSFKFMGARPLTAAEGYLRTQRNNRHHEFSLRVFFHDSFGNVVVTINNESMFCGDGQKPKHVATGK